MGLQFLHASLPAGYALVRLPDCFINEGPGEMTANQASWRISSVLVFFMASLLAWIIWVPQVLHRFGLVAWAPSLQSPLNAITVWAPGLAAMLVLHRESGVRGIKVLFSQIKLWRVSPTWYLVALLFEPLRWVVALGIDRVLGLRYELGEGLLGVAFGPAAAFMIPVTVIFTLPNALGEELGWRGFALPRLQSRYGAIIATLWIGLFWGFWHIPAWVAWGDAQFSWFSVGLLVVSAIPAAAVFTWLYNRTGGSLLIVVLYHASIANKGYFIPDLPTYTETALLWAFAFFLMLRGYLSPQHDGRQ